MVASNNFRKHGIRNLSSKSSIDKGLLNALSDATHRSKKMVETRPAHCRQARRLKWVLD